MARTALLTILAAMLVSACALLGGGPDPADQEARTLTLAVLPAVYVPDSAAPDAAMSDPAALDEATVPLALRMARTSLQNALAGKGQTMIPASLVDQALAGVTPGGDMAELASDLGADGLVRPVITAIRAADNLPHDAFLISGSADLVLAEGEPLGPWQATVSARDLPDPTGPVSAGALLFETVAGRSAAQTAHSLASRWGMLMAESVAPGPPDPDLPDIRTVETNAHLGAFGRDQLVAVRMIAEPGLSAVFFLGGYRTGLPLACPDPQRPDEYVGLYQVRPEDRAEDLDLVIRADRQGAERVWTDECGLRLDGQEPAPPGDFAAQPDQGGILLTWTAPDSDEDEDDPVLFVVQRSDRAKGGYATLGLTPEPAWLDEGVLQGGAYHYRILTQDPAGNRSLPSPAARAVAPRKNPDPLPSVVSGVLGPGPHLVSDVTMVPEGANLRVPAGAELIFEPGAALLVDGRLVLAGNEDTPVVLSGREWHGVAVSPGGRLVASRVRMLGCEFCLLAEEAEVALDRVSLSGGPGTGAELVNCRDFALEGVEVRDFRNGVVLTDSQGHLTGSTIRKNAIGLTVTGGGVDVVRNDISDNGVDVASDRPLTLRENYLGSTDPGGLRLEGPVEVKSLLTDPPLHGRVVDVDMNREERLDRFLEFRNAGAAAFAQGRYRAAGRALSEALALFPDRDLSLLLALAREAAGQDPLPGLREALYKHPKDARLHMAMARALAGQGRIGEALDTVRQGLTSQPGHQGLLQLEAVLKNEPGS